jgi:hypothetical protein
MLTFPINLVTENEQDTSFIKLKQLFKQKTNLLKIH